MLKRIYLIHSIILFLTIWALSCTPQTNSVKDVMDGVVTRFYDTMDENELSSLTDEKIMQLLTVDEKKILATHYWMFDVNMPATVSIMRDVDQQHIPFWLEKAGFEKTDLSVRNEEYTYEVWQKNFDPGRVELGINGFDMHRPHYFVAVGPQKAGQKLILSHFYPENQHIERMDNGAFTYHDWDELVLTEVPEEMRGLQLLTTIRGRAREAHLINAFRKTPFPSSTQPDQIMLTWGEDPRTSQSVQWRCNTSVKNGAVKFWPADGEEETEAVQQAAVLQVMEDRLLQNDRFVHRFSAVLKNLKPDTKYLYRVGDPAGGPWSGIHHFKTAVKEGQPFSFIYFGDTHRSPQWGKLINKAFERHPQSDFFTIGGDIVSTGLYRDDWDKLFEYSADVISERPLMPTLGNHDSQDGLGVWMYRDLFDLPENGPSELEPERTYSFTYGNALFLMVDATAPNQINTDWLRQQLNGLTATWKFAVFHFPPYVFDSEFDTDYKEIREQWGALFDEYHVDMVLSGHVHHYMRTKPIYNQQVMADPSQGTVYIISIGIPNKKFDMPARNFIAKGFGGEMLYQTFEIDGGQLVYKTFNLDGDLRDELTIIK